MRPTLWMMTKAKAIKTDTAFGGVNPADRVCEATLVAHSYGVLGTLIAATRTPARVHSLTQIEPPLYYLVPGDPEVERLKRVGNAVLSEGLDTDPATLREFLRLAGAPNVDDGPLSDAVARGVRRAHGSRTRRGAPGARSPS